MESKKKLEKSEEKKDKKELTFEELKQKLSEKKLALERCEHELKSALKEKEEYLAGWQRARADFLNYKKEEMERIEGLLKYANEEIILKILPILDDFEIAEKKLSKESKNNPDIKGLLQIKSHFQNFLKIQGVERIRTIGEKFDPNFHEIVEEIEMKNQKSGMIIEEVQGGYILNDKVIRAAKVKIAK